MEQKELQKPTNSEVEKELKKYVYDPVQERKNKGFYQFNVHNYAFEKIGYHGRKEQWELSIDSQIHDERIVSDRPLRLNFVFQVDSWKNFYRFNDNNWPLIYSNELNENELENIDTLGYKPDSNIKYHSLAGMFKTAEKLVIEHLEMSKEYFYKQHKQDQKNFKNWSKAIDKIYIDYYNLTEENNWIANLAKQTIQESDDDFYKNILNNKHSFAFGYGEYDEDNETRASYDFDLRLLSKSQNNDEEEDVYEFNKKPFIISYSKQWMPLKTKKQWYETFKEEVTLAVTKGLDLNFSEVQKQKWEIQSMPLINEQSNNGRKR